jgi:hypothetical protein
MSNVQREYEESLYQHLDREGTLWQRYQIYLACANDGTGNSITNGKPLKTFEEWINS